jgi:RNA polymerase sigma-70 factor (ECF subfamily)
MDPLSFRIFEGGKSSARLPNEPELIRAAQRGDTTAFQEIYEHYKDRVYNLICYSLKDGSQAEDALQCVFLKVVQALPNFRMESSFLTWIYYIAVNECKNRRRRKNFFVPLTSLSVENLPVQETKGPDSTQAADERAHKVREAVMALKPKYRTVVVLKYLEDLSYQEISSILGVSAGTVASRLYRALNLLSKSLWNRR